MKYLKLSLSTFVAASCFITVANAHSGEFCTLANAALLKNHNITALRHAGDAANERIIQAKNANGAKFNLLANLQAYSARQGSKTINTDATLSLSYGQTLYDSGLSDALTQKARGGSELLNLDIAASSQDTILKVAREYVTYLQNIQLLALHKKNMANSNKQLSNIEDKFAASEATQQELSMVQSQVRQSMSKMLRAKAQVLLARVKLLSLTNKKPNGSDRAFLPTLLNKTPKSRSAAIIAAKNNSIEIGKTDIQIDMAQSEILAQEAAMGPTIQVSGRFGFGKIASNTGAAGQVGLSFSVPLFSSDVLDSRVREAKAMLASARARRAYMTELSKQNVSASFEIAQSLEQSINILPKAIRAEEAAISSLEQSLASSFIPIAELLLVKNSVFELKVSLINLKFERYFGNLDLLNSIGQLQDMNTLHKVGLCR